MICEVGLVLWLNHLCYWATRSYKSKNMCQKVAKVVNSWMVPTRYATEMTLIASVTNQAFFFLSSNGWYHRLRINHSIIWSISTESVYKKSELNEDWSVVVGSLQLLASGFDFCVIDSTRMNHGRERSATNHRPTPSSTADDRPVTNLSIFSLIYVTEGFKKNAVTRSPIQPT